MTMSIGGIVNGAKLLTEGVGNLISKVPQFASGLGKAKNIVVDDLLMPMEKTFSERTLKSIEGALSTAGKQAQDFVVGKIKTGTKWLAKQVSNLFSATGVKKTLEYMGIAQTINTLFNQLKKMTAGSDGIQVAK